LRRLNDGRDNERALDERPPFAQKAVSSRPKIEEIPALARRADPRGKNIAGACGASARSELRIVANERESAFHQSGKSCLDRRLIDEPKVRHRARESGNRRPRGG